MGNAKLCGKNYLFIRKVIILLEENITNKRIKPLFFGLDKGREIEILPSEQ